MKQLLSGRRDSNPHASRRQILSLVRLPISPRPAVSIITWVFFETGRKNRGIAVSKSSGQKEMSFVLHTR